MNSLDGDDYAEDFAWVASAKHRLQSREVKAFLDEDCWGNVNHCIHIDVYGMWGGYFRIGIYGFQVDPYFLELIRLAWSRELPFSHLFAPIWVAHTAHEMLYKRPEFPDSFYPIPGSGPCVRAAFGDCQKALVECVDPHVGHLKRWLIQGEGYRVPKYAWSADARNGRFDRQPNGTTYCSGVTPSSYTTGGVEAEFNRRIALMLGQAKFELLTSHVNVVTREQYMMAGRRWAQFCACSDISPWIKESSRVRGTISSTFLRGDISYWAYITSHCL